MTPVYLAPRIGRRDIGDWAKALFCVIIASYARRQQRLPADPGPVTISMLFEIKGSMNAGA